MWQNTPTDMTFCNSPTIKLSNATLLCVGRLYYCLRHSLGWISAAVKFGEHEAVPAADQKWSLGKDQLSWASFIWLKNLQEIKTITVSIQRTFCARSSEELRITMFSKKTLELLIIISSFIKMWNRIVSNAVDWQSRQHNLLNQLLSDVKFISVLYTRLFLFYLSNFIVLRYM